MQCTYLHGVISIVLHNLYVSKVVIYLRTLTFIWWWRCRVLYVEHQTRVNKAVIIVGLGSNDGDFRDGFVAELSFVLH